MKYILGKKLKMASIFQDHKQIPVTLIEAGPCFVTQIKTVEKDGYNAVQIGFDSKKNISKPMNGHLKKSGRESARFLREFKPEDISPFKEGDAVELSLFAEGEIVTIAGISKGKGFAGVVKKWDFRGRSTSHGTKHEQRTGGSIGCSFPERVIKGKKMPGRMGSERITVKNLKIIKIDSENGILALKGAVPGNRGSLLEIVGK